MKSSHADMQHNNFSFEAIGTRWNIEIFDKLSPPESQDLLKHIKIRIDVFDSVYSRFRSDSLVSKMAQKAGDYHLPSDAKPLIDLYFKLYKITDGLVTPLIGQTLSDAGYDAQYSFRPGKVSAPPAWQDVITYNFPNIHLKQPVLLDFGAAGKGYIVDIIADLIECKGISNYCINAGGDMLHHSASHDTLQAALEHPADETMAIGIATIANQSLCGSAGNRRRWDRYHHTINPATLTSPTHIQAVWVVAESALVADVLTTALYFTDPVILRKHFSFEYAMVMEDFSLRHSLQFPAEFYVNK